MKPTFAWIAPSGRGAASRIAPLAAFVFLLGATGSLFAQPSQTTGAFAREEAVADKDWVTWSEAVSSAIDDSGDRFAGKYSPSRLLTIVRLKGPEVVAPRFAVLSAGRFEIRFVSGAAFNEEEAAEVISRAAKELKKSCPEVMGGRYDVVSDTFVLNVDPKRRSGCKYPEKVEGVQLRTFGVGKVEELSLRGGGVIQGIGTCTAGFTAQTLDEQFKFILGAEHCGSEALERIYTTADGLDVHNVERVGGAWDGSRDVQWLAPSSPTTAVEALVNVTNSLALRVRSVAPRSLLVGEMVCHNGRITGASCGIVATTKYDPDENADEDRCGPAQNLVDCDPTWLQVWDIGYFDGPPGVHSGELKCEYGDSGGPWYMLNFPRVAVALTSGRQTLQQSVNPDQCDIAVVMHLDLLEGLGLKVMKSHVGVLNRASAMLLKP